MEINEVTGRKVLELIADSLYTRHSEGAFCRLSNGHIAYVYSRFTGSSHDDAPSHIALSVSADEGETWSEPEKILDPADFNTHNIMSVSLIELQDGGIGLFFGSRQTPSVGYKHLLRSYDDLKTFQDETICSLADRPGYYVLNNDRVVRLRSGRLVMPVAFHRGGYSKHNPGSVYFENRGVLSFRLSDDDGNTWRESTDVVYPPFTRTRSGLQEPGVIECMNGVLWAFARTDQMHQYECFSFDGGEHWTAAQPSRFTGCNAPLQIKRAPQDQSLIAVWNPIPNYNGRTIYPGFAGRTPIVYARSYDDGLTWSEPFVLDGRPDSGYCYPAIFFTNDHSMLVSYCSGSMKEGDCLSNTTVRKVAL